MLLAGSTFASTVTSCPRPSISHELSNSCTRCTAPPSISRAMVTFVVSTCRGSSSPKLLIDQPLLAPRPQPPQQPFRLSVQQQIEPPSAAGTLQANQPSRLAIAEA